MEGHIFQINTSRGGVPKLAQPEGEVTVEGLQADRQRNRKHHGGPDRALCLFPLERILELQREGHQIFPGAIGENVTISGLEWGKVIPGTTLRLGEQVIITITGYTHPCKNIVGAFADGNFNRVSPKKNPGGARLYARVIQTGRIRVGDPVRLLEPAS